MWNILPAPCVADAVAGPQGVGMMRPMQRIAGLGEALRAVGESRQASSDPRIRERVADILRAVSERGDAAVGELTERFDGVALSSFVVPQADIAAAEGELDASLKGAIRTAVDRVTSFYEHQPSEGFLHATEAGLLGQIVRPLDSVACYVPGGTAPLFSSLLMAAVPARVAQVPRIVAATPPRRDGSVPAEILFTAHVLGIDVLYRIGGAQAIAALAYGTETIAGVDKIVGPGNDYVIEAKRALYGVVGIEALPGPTETLIVADGAADLDHVVSDLLAQAEHLGAQPVLVTTDATLAGRLEAALASALSDLPTKGRASESLTERGLLITVDTLDDALEVANAYAPEHLCLLIEDPWRAVSRVRNAGGIFVGAHSLESLGDYIAGPSHIMPTGGTARFASSVNVRDFQKVIPVVDLSPAVVQRLGPDAARMARAEGLEAHARAVEARLE